MTKDSKKQRKRNRDQKKKQKQQEHQNKIEREQLDIKNAIPLPAEASALSTATNGYSNGDHHDSTTNDTPMKMPSYEIEYVSMDENLLAPGRHVTEFKHVFDFFTTSMGKLSTSGGNQKQDSKSGSSETKDAFAKASEQHEEKKEKQLSKKQRKLNSRMKVFDLKMKIRRPDMVEAWDITAKDPLFLMEMKMVRNSVPVPRHWSQKRRYLQYKRGVHKVPFKLPDYIEQTGISKVREQSHDKHKSLKQKMRERMQPKMGKIDIDYQILHDAFFKNQKKSKLTNHGDLYYEGKEYEIRMRGYKPGRLSPELRHALGIPENSPPPWLINMQRYGPPPAYPNLRIPGVNAPIPETITYGFGRLFTDEKGFTVYADCHGLNKAVYQKRQNRKPYWGSIKEGIEEEDEDFEEEEEEAEDEEEEPEYEGIGRNNLDLGEQELYEEQARLEQLHQQEQKVSFDDLKTGIQSLIQNTSTAATGDTEKGSKVPLPSEPRPLYDIIPEVKGSVGSGGEIFGASYGYAIPGGAGADHKDVLEVNIQKTVEIGKEKDGDKDDEKKKKDKKDKYKVKF